MSAPAHSVEPHPPAGTGSYAARNNFLFLLLGLISSAERVLGTLPGALGADDVTPGDGLRPTVEQQARDRDGLLR